MIQERIKIIIEKLFDGNQKKASEAIKINAPALHSYISGRTKPNYDAMEKLFSYGINPVWLFTGRDDMILKKYDKHLINYLKPFVPENSKEVLNDFFHRHILYRNKEETSYITDTQKGNNSFIAYSYPLPHDVKGLAHQYMIGLVEKYNPKNDLITLQNMIYNKDENIVEYFERMFPFVFSYFVIQNEEKYYWCHLRIELNTKDLDKTIVTYNDIETYFKGNFLDYFKEIFNIDYFGILSEFIKVENFEYLERLNQLKGKKPPF